MLNKFLYGIFVLMTAVFISCGTYKTPFIKSIADNQTKESLPTDKKKKHILYLIGDSGDVDEPDSEENYVLSYLTDKVTAGDEKNQSVIFLGDNLYPKGLHSKKHSNRESEEKILNSQLNVVANNKTKAYFIPGNHDWNKMGKGGRKFVKRQEEYVESYYDKKKKIKFFPDNACGDPEVVEVDKNLVLLFIDSQWWLQDWSREKKMNHHCHVDSRREFVDEIEDIFIKYKNKQIVVMLHHPFFSNGNHGGNYSFKQHVFPLTGVSPSLYIPLPILGSIYPLFRQLGGSPQDIASDEHTQLLKELRKASMVAKQVIFVSGHEHLLQYNYDKSEHFIVSGSASKVSYSKGGGDAEFVYSKRGYAELHYYEDGEIWMDLITVNPDESHQVEYRKQLVEPKAGTVESEASYSDDLDEYKLTAANVQFGHSKFTNAIVGSQYRDIWTTEVNTPIIDLKNTKGGLVPIKKGGGMASNSLRMEAPDGKQYILRSINKDYRKLVPEGWRRLSAINIMKDQNSASHPYGALVIPSLSKAAGIYYTEPKLVYLSHQKQLGNYNELFPEEMYLFEERPAGDWSDHAPFGNSDNIIGYNDLLLNLRKKKEQYIDQEWVLKSRLFDMWIHDWDRHDDQWRWAGFKEDGKTIYRPIPRDRDQAFYKFIGLVPRIVAGLVERKFKTFDHKIKDVPALNFNAKHFDRYFLNELNWQEWKTVVHELQQEISEQDIKDAMDALPEEVRGVQEIEVVEKLIQRKKDLLKYARELYEFINAGVDVTGTDRADLFVVERLSNGHTNVKVYEGKKQKKSKLKFDRIFEPDVVKDIRLYGLEDKDHFIITGDSKNAIKLQIIGGLGKDELDNESLNRKKNKVIVYDSPDGIKIDHKKSIVDKRSDDLHANEYDRNQFKYNTSFPFPVLGYTGDDGFWFGFSNSLVKHGYRKDPFKSKHSYSISLSQGLRNTIKAYYNGNFHRVLGKLSYKPSIAFENPMYINYFGLGNDTALTTDELSFNWVRMSSFRVESLFSYEWNHGNSSFTFGPHMESNDLKPQDDRILSVSEDFEPDDFDRKYLLGIKGNYKLESKDHGNAPERGIEVNLHTNYMKYLTTDDYVASIGANLAFYLPVLIKPNLVLGSRTGYHKVFGIPQVYHYPAMGQNNFLRGYRNDRYRGEGIFYQQIDLRMKLFHWDNKVLPFTLGVVAGYDIGRVFDETSSDDFHSSKIAGLSFNILDAILFHPSMSYSDDGNYFTFLLGYAF